MANANSSNKLKSTTQQEEEKRDEKGRFAPGYKPPVGFHTNPERQSPGGWDKENTISYQYNRFLRVAPDKLTEAIQADKEAGKWTVAKDLAYRRVQAAQNSLPDMKEITDRTEGKALQVIDQNISGELKTGTADPKLAEDFAAFLKDKTKSE